MKCTNVRELIQLYIDSELDTRGTLEVQQHLEVCSACSRVLDDYMKQDEALRRYVRETPVDASRIREEILAAVRREPVPARLPFLPGWRRAAAIAVLAVSAVLLSLQTGLIPGLRENVHAAVVSDHVDHCAIEMVMGAVTSAEELDKLASTYGSMDRLPDLTAFGFSRPRARACKIGRAEFLHIIYYGPGDQPLSVFLRPRTTRLIADHMISQDERDHKVISVSRSQVEVLVVSQLDETRTTEITHAVVSHVNG